MCQKFIDHCIEDEEEEILRFIETDPSIIFYKDQYNRSGLMYAAEYGYDNLIALLSTEETVNQIDIDGNTPLTFALLGDLPGHIRAVKLLYSFGATKVNKEYFPTSE